jgi:two-component system, sensor histidine kinase and response regulator
MNKQIRILYLDDEEHNLKSFKAIFRHDYSVYTALTTQEAFNIVEKHRPNIVFSDQRMPRMTGVEFFSKLKDIYPEGIRILLTGYADVNNVIESINKGHVYRYLTKPWSEDEIRLAIENGYELYQTRLELKNKMKHLERTNEELNRFIYSASHDLRSPIVSALGLLDVAKMEIDDPGTNEYLDMIKDSVLRMDGYIQNIIKFYQNRGKNEEITEVDFAGLYAEVLEDLRSYMELKKIKVTADIQQSRPFLTDGFRLRIILNNLISNALKFQREDETNAFVHIAFTQNEKESVISVKDNGMGFSPEYKDKIYKMFFRGTSKVHGTGMGLYIVKEAVRSISGQIEVRTEPGKGTEFIVTVPDLVPESSPVS